MWDRGFSLLPFKIANTPYPILSFVDVTFHLLKYLIDYSTNETSLTCSYEKFWS